MGSINTSMSYTITEESFTSLNSHWTDSRHNLNWSSIFVLPSWLQSWWQVFGTGAELYLRAVRQGEKIIGIAPLSIKDKTASIIGSIDVCDYLDFIVAPDREKGFFSILLNDLKQKGIAYLDLGHLRPDSTTIAKLVGIAKERNYYIDCRQEEVSLELELPPTWDEYLMMLKPKQRHEVKRKLRRLWEAGNVVHRCLEIGQEIEGYMEIFLRLFMLNREDKKNFMTPQMGSFFKSLAKSMAKVGLLRFGIIELDTQPIAMTMGFDYHDSHYLYNSAYDARFNYLSVGLLCKVLCLKESIEKGKKKWDFLKGGESYKYHLGGKEIPLYSCHITIK